MYRKHFALPAGWRGSRVSVRFEGVYKVATVYVNGAEVKRYGGAPGDGGSSDSAYTAFEVRLDNVSGVAFGGDNVVAVAVEGSSGTEHHPNRFARVQANAVEYDRTFKRILQDEPRSPVSGVPSAVLAQEVTMEPAWLNSIFATQ